MSTGLQLRPGRNANVHSELEQCKLRQLLKLLETALGQDLTVWKDVIKSATQGFMQQKTLAERQKESSGALNWHR